MSPTEILAFDAAAQADMEESFPAVILFAGADTPVNCAGGTNRRTDAKAMIGGILAEYSLFFRIQRALASPPPVGTCFQWKRQGAPDWDPRTATVARVSDLPQSTAFVIYGENPGQ